MRDGMVAEFNDVRFCYGEVCAVERVGFTIPMNGLTALVGPNGGGKSTLLKLMSGILKPTHGQIMFDQRRKIGYVSQNLDIDRSFPITVKEVALTGTLTSSISPFFRYKKENEQAAHQALAHVGLTGFENRGIQQLSGGQLARMIIARAIASNADIILLDEPDSSLDIDAAENLYAMLNELKQHKTLVVVSHHVDQILEIADLALYVNREVTVYDQPNELKETIRGGGVL